MGLNYMAKARQAAGQKVRASPEAERIFSLPRRTEVVVSPFEEFRKTPSGLGNFDLRPKQAQALYELVRYGGLMGSLALGEGKTGVALLAGTVVGAKRTVYLLPPELYYQVVEVDYPAWSEHWKLPKLDEALFVVRYSDLSSKRSEKHDVLERISPDLIVADEAQTISRPNIRTKRLRRYERSAKPRRVNLSGTFIDRTIKEPAPLAAATLGAGSPYPRDWQTLDAWSWALDEKPMNSPPGILQKFVDPGKEGTLDEVRDGFRQWVTETPGFVVSTGEQCGSKLVFRSRPLKLPAQVEKALAELRRLWVRPDGEELASPLEFYRCANTLALGFYLRWKEKPPSEWLEARSAWVSERSTFLKNASRPGLDSPALVAEAAARGELPKLSHYARWAEIEQSYKPAGEAVWLDYFAVVDAGTWARENTGIVWVEHPAFGELIGHPWFGGGDRASSDILKERATRSIVASVSAHHLGKNLQYFSSALITTPRSSARRMGQTIGRIHRPRQQAETVNVDFYLHTEEYKASLEAATRLAKTNQKLTGELQKLCIGSWEKLVK